jgi:hypothetical protein
MSEQIRIEAKPGGNGRLFIGDTEISQVVTGLQLSVDATHPPELHLRMDPFDVETIATSVRTRVDLPERVEVLLAAAGWTRPADTVELRAQMAAADAELARLRELLHDQQQDAIERSERAE